ncbi:MAG TPA: cellulase family glycosylhydrolase [Candidatus Hydrogenedentes bacterium]|nr:cellulase family glycosylhydrolase [Candidatus Hydrogenedentota bacterium]HPG70159.1 cellulase family glycosylhydrolase [Candidatus Hydrogenedentota bacterium]
MVTGSAWASGIERVALVVVLAGLIDATCAPGNQPNAAGLEWIRLDEAGEHFVGASSGKEFRAWGVNYDHDGSGRLIEEYWHEEWATVAEDFGEMKALGVNVVRVHLQLARFMNTADTPSEAALDQLARLVRLAETTGLYLDVTGLGCYHKHEVPAWYDALDEAGRWDVQALFWAAVAKTCAASPAIFCYDLMNEPILPGVGQTESDWLAGEFGGKYFVQRIALDLAGRTREEVAKAWVDKLVAAIRRHDTRHLITVGVIPWAYTFPGARPLFYSDAVGANLDFASVHFYPEKGEVGKALDALAVYDVGKPLIIEEMFPLRCGQEEMDTFIDGSRSIAEGWVSFYWGKTIEDYGREDSGIAGAIMKSWIEYWRAKGPEMVLSTED